MGGQDSYLVIGGCGFLGRHIVEQLIARGETQVAVFDLVQRHFDDNVTFYTGDITMSEDIGDAINKSKATVVIHTASPVHGLGPAIYEKVNVLGTQTVIDACITHSVPKLVYTSSAGVVYNGEENLIDVDERMAIPEKAMDNYNETKAKAEKLVLEANGKEGLLTCALRPAGIFGPGDRQGIQGFMSVVKNGQTKYQIGQNTNLFDWTYVGNVAYAHLLAADRLDASLAPWDLSYPLDNIYLSTGYSRIPTSTARPLGPMTNPTEEDLKSAEKFKSPKSSKEDETDLSPVLRTRMDQFSGDAKSFDDASERPESLPVAGQVFFITNCEPLYFWDFARALWKGAGHIYSGRHWVMSASIGLVLASLSEAYSKLVGKEPGFTQFRVKYACQNRYYDVERARRFLGYEPVYGVDEGIQKTLQWYNAEQKKIVS